MAVLDLRELTERKNQISTKRREAVAWGQEALSEFQATAVALDTPTYGNPSFLKEVFGRQALQGVWPILRTGNTENLLIDVGHGAAALCTGGLWAGGSEEGAEYASSWIAARCGFSIELMREVIESALLGDSWTVRDALKSAPSSR